jgi:hypothetical protein
MQYRAMLRMTLRTSFLPAIVALQSCSIDSIKSTSERFGLSGFLKR